MPGSEAEEALAALARDLVEEIAAGRALELAGDFDPEALALSVFNVRPFQRRSPSGTHMEQVRGHTESKLPGTGAQPEGGPRGYIPPDDWAQGQQEWKAKGEAAWKKHEWKSKGKPKSMEGVQGDISRTMFRLPSGRDSKNESKDLAKERSPAYQLPEWEQAAHHLSSSLTHLRSKELGSEAGQIDQPAAARAYHELAKAHHHIVTRILPHADPDKYPDIAQHLQRVAGHMQDLDRAMGSNPELTRKTLGDFKSVFAHAGEERPRGGVAGRISGAAAERKAEAVWDTQFLLPGKRVFDRRVPGQTGTVAASDPGRVNVKFDHGLSADYEADAAADYLHEAAPEPKKGAAAVHAQLGGSQITLPGDTLSGHGHAHVPRPFEVKPPDAKDQALEEAAQHLAGHHQADAQRIAAEQAAVEAQRTGIPVPGTYAPLDDTQYMLHTLDAENAVTAALKAGHSTDKTETLDGHGRVWKAERAAAHNEIVSKLLAKATTVPSEGKGLVMGGIMGAGKSTTLKNVPGIDLSRYAMVGPDDIKAELARRGMVPQVEGLSPLEASSLVHQESSHVANLLADELFRRGKNVALDTAMSNRRYTDHLLRAMREHGYQDVQGVFVDTPPETAVERARSRHRSGLEKYRQGKDPLGGRLVPADLIRSAEIRPGVTANRETFDSLRGKFDGWQVWDNSGAKPVLSARSGSGPGSSGITSVEDLMREQQARVADAGVAPVSGP